MMILTSDIPSHDLPCLNVKFPDRPLGRCILDKDSGSNYGELEQTLINILDSHRTEFNRKEEKSQWAQRDWFTYMKEATYWQKMKLIGSIWSLLTIMFAIDLFFAIGGLCMLY